MFDSSKRNQLLIGLSLSVVMMVTRFNHFGSPVSLPDASLAVFFLAGLYLSRRVWFPALVLEAAVLDWASVAGGVSDWCVTAAYGFLIPAYASLWIAGRWYAPRARMAWVTLAPLAGSLATAVTVAFVIANMSFYLFSGYFDAMSWTDYMRDTLGYYPPYAGYTFMYVCLAAGMHVVRATLSARAQSLSGS